MDAWVKTLFSGSEGVETLGRDVEKDRDKSYKGSFALGMHISSCAGDSRPGPGSLKRHLVSSSLEMVCWFNYLASSGLNAHLSRLETFLSELQF